MLGYIDRSFSVLLQARGLLGRVRAIIAINAPAHQVQLKVYVIGDKKKNTRTSTDHLDQNGDDRGRLVDMML
jgi:hypothetical protein